MDHTTAGSASSGAAQRPSHGTGGPRPWPPVVLDVPTIPFEPRPPFPYGYRPDTICDGWSTSDFRVRLASVRGYAHRYSGLSRQDAVDVRAHPGSGALVIAVADGVSSARQSEIGAVTACAVLVEATLDALDRDPHRIDLVDITRWTAAQMLHRLGGGADTGGGPGGQGGGEGNVGEHFATTLVAGILRRRPQGGAAATLLQIGDTGAWLLRRGRFHIVLDHKMGAPSTVTSSAVRALPWLPEDLRTVEIDVPPDAVLLIGTDGFGDPLGDGTGLVGGLFTEVLAGVPGPLELAHALDFSRETFDDDRTLVAVWPEVGAA